MFASYYRGRRYRPDITEYKTFHVLETLSCIRDDGTRQGHFSRKYQKAVAAAMKARGK